MRLNKQICVGILGFLPITAGMLASPAAAQLRTGREQRMLYHEQLVSEQKSKTKDSKRDSHVAQAAYTEGEAVRSILDSAPGQPVGSGRANSALNQIGAVHEPVVHEPVYSDDGYVQSEATSGCSCGHCGGGLVSGCGCSSGCDDFSGLAPTCASTCGAAGCSEAMFTGCGPLANLLRGLSVRAEVPLYWRRAAGPPTLVTTSPVGTAQGVAGELGQTTTRTLLGGNGPLGDKANAGFRITAGTWLGRDQYYGLLFRYWNAGNHDETFRFNSNQNAILARPFLNTTTGNGVQDTQ